jgi:DNA-binding IclR family transcriptional regulator
MLEVGIVIPAHATALGKALLAFDPTAHSLALTPGAPLRSMTGATITDRAVLREELEQVRASAIATEVEEAVIGECSVAAPLADATDEAAGALGLVVPSASWPVDATAIDALRSTARAISRELGARTWPPRSTPHRPPASA